MEGAMEEWEESAESGTTSTQVDTEAPDNREHDDEPRSLQEPEGDERVDSDACDACPGVVEPGQIALSFSVDILDDDEEGVCISDTETLPQETLTDTNTQDDADTLSSTLLPGQEELTHPSVSPHPSSTQNHTPEPCWYCLRSLDAEYRPETAEQEDPDPLSPLPSSGPKVNYQTDPRPHFGVAWSFHSTCRPLWGSEGPCWGQRKQEAPNQMHTCPHCHLGLPPDTLRWHEAKCLLFEGLRNSNK